MANVFISALIAIFFLGKTTKDVRDKTMYASWFRTFVYLFLTIIFGLVFYKSYQVATIVNIVTLNNYRGAEDYQGRPKDKVTRIDIFNRFGGGSYSNDILKLSYRLRESDLFSHGSGCGIKIEHGDYSADEIVNRYSLNDDGRRFFENKLNRSISDLGPIYLMSFTSTNIPSFIPFYPKINNNGGEYYGDNIIGFHSLENTKGSQDFFFSSESGEKSLSSEEKSQILKNGINAQRILAIPDIERWENCRETNRTNITDDNFFGLSAWLSHPLVNAINIFTAADLSQYTYVLMISSDMEIDGVVVEYDQPIEMEISVDDLKVYSNAFYIGKDFFEKYGQTAMFHIKLPAMANLQMIRSLILTALLTTVFSIFCSNLYYCFRKSALIYRKKHPQKISVLRRISRKRINMFRNFIYFIVFLFLGLVLTMVYYVVCEKNILVNMAYLWLIIAVIITVVLSIGITIFFLYKHAITPLPKKRGREKIKAKKK